ncbi:acyltransferase family protein [Afifella sp. IM 167]|uniref:acyltransferase family protein n=1 Tax=Afifella sp. IM 167 TaxID=2033586 RepID=UPI001CC9CE1F|nr:acyltransferase family protein [Afifella sp. IM 167]MBZ8133545.1 acyltransferase [Afifella sp. IM 167]
MNAARAQHKGRGRVAWVDVAKGFCIIMVVMMHSVLGVEQAMGHAGFMGDLVEFARPFRMPDFFMIAGLFLAARITAPLRLYVDRKIVHFAYFYVLWLTIQFVFKAPEFAAQLGWPGALGFYLKSFVDPFGTLWFIYHLAIFFAVTRLVHGRVPFWLVWLAGAALEVAHIETGSMLIDEFAARFVYFYTGFILADAILGFAARIDRHAMLGVAYLAIWGCVNAALVFGGVSTWPFISLALGFAGALAVCVFAVLLVRTLAARPLKYLGAHSIVVYLSFFLPMVVTRQALLGSGLPVDVVSLIVTCLGLIGPVLLFEFTRRTGWCTFLFERPAWARIDRPGHAAPQKAAIAPAD